MRTRSRAPLAMCVEWSGLGASLRRSLWTICVAVILIHPGSLLAQGPGIAGRVAALEQQSAAQAQQLTALQQQVAALLQQIQGLGALQPLDLTVDCGAGQTVSAALAQAGGRASQVRITIVGVCSEAVNVMRSRTVLRAGSPGAGLESPSDTTPVLSVNAGEVVVDGLTLSGGIGVTVSSRGQVLFVRTLMKDSTFHGLMSFGGRVELMHSTVQGSAGVGIQAIQGSHLRLGQSVIQNNAFALDVGSGSFGLLDGGTQVRSNGSGVGVSFGSMLQVGQVVIEDNGGAGLMVVGGSMVHFGFAGGIAIIRGNMGHGLYLRDTSVASELFSGSGKAEILNNGGFGVFCSPPPAVAQLAGPIGTVAGNAAGQISCPVGF